VTVTISITTYSLTTNVQWQFCHRLGGIGVGTIAFLVRYQAVRLQPLKDSGIDCAEKQLYRFTEAVSLITGSIHGECEQWTEAACCSYRPVFVQVLWT